MPDEKIPTYQLMDMQPLVTRTPVPDIHIEGPDDLRTTLFDVLSALHQAGLVTLSGPVGEEIVRGDRRRLLSNEGNPQGVVVTPTVMMEQRRLRASKARDDG